MNHGEINYLLGQYQSMINKHPELNKLVGYSISVTEFISNPNSHLCENVYKEFYNSLQILATLLNANLLGQVDMHSRKKLIQKERDYIKISMTNMKILEKVFKTAEKLGINTAYTYQIDLLKEKPCSINNVYLENEILEKMQKICVKVPGGDWKRTFCEQLNSLQQYKEMIENNLHPSEDLYENYQYIWNLFQESFIRLMFTNYITFHMQGIVPCLGQFLDQQIQLKIDLLEEQNRKAQKGNSKIPNVLTW